MKTTTLITSALIDRVPERSMSLGFASVTAPVSSLDAHAHVAAVALTDASPADVTTCVATVAAPAKATSSTDVATAAHANLWLGGFQGEGFGSGAYGIKRIQPGRLEAMT